MKFSVVALLANFTDGKLVAPKALEKKLDCEDQESATQLQIALDAMERLGVLSKERGKYRRVSTENQVEGRLRCSSKGFCFAIQDDEEAEDVYIRECHLHNAWNGDRVLVRVTKEGSRRRSPEGEVMMILERANTSVLARVKQVEEDYRAVPLDDRLLFELNLQNDTTELAEAVEHLVNVEVMRYPIAQHPPFGQVTQVLGSTAEAASDIDIVCCKHSLPTQFPEAALEAAKDLPTKVRKTDFRKRQDLRKQPAITIHVADPQHTEGENSPVETIIDSALTVTALKGGGWKLGIHTADVAAYVPLGSPLDQEAQRRGTTVYLGETIIPLFPQEISNQLGCLHAGQERLAITLEVTLDAAGTVQEFELLPSVIEVDHQLNYAQAQAILSRDPKATVKKLPDEIKPLKDIFSLVDDLAAAGQQLRLQRQKRGAFEFNLPEHLSSESNPAVNRLGSDWFSRFAYNDEGSLGAMLVAEELPIRAVLAEVMILANQLVASHLQALEVPALYRVHRPPEPIQVQDVIKLVENMGLNLEIQGEEGVEPQDYQHFLQQFATSQAERVLTYLLQETLRPATYSMTPGKHFGLALEGGYAHFTCPTRRYADLMVQRVLHLMFKEGRDRRSVRAKDIVNLRHSSCHGQINWNVLPPETQSEVESHIQQIVVHLSEREKLALEAEEDLIGLKKAEFMKAHTGEVFQGLITGVQSYGFFVEIEDLLVEGLVHVSSLKDDWYEYRSRQQRLVGRKNRQQYRLGDRVEVQVKNVDYYRQQIDLAVVGGGSQQTDEDEEDEGENYSYSEEES
ncbi:MAG: ribonuclease R family protein [Prochlorothrix sp.]